MAESDRGSLSLAIILLVLVAKCIATTWIDKCYCPGKDPILNVLNKAKDLRNKMYELKSAHTSKKLNIWWRKLDHKPGVPPLSVLIKMFPKMEESDLRNVSLNAYKNLLDNAKEIVESRKIALLTHNGGEDGEEVGTETLHDSTGITSSESSFEIGDQAGGQTGSETGEETSIENGSESGEQYHGGETGNEAGEETNNETGGHNEGESAESEGETNNETGGVTGSESGVEYSGGETEGETGNEAGEENSNEIGGQDGGVTESESGTEYSGGETGGQNEGKTGGETSTENGGKIEGEVEAETGDGRKKRDSNREDFTIGDSIDDLENEYNHLTNTFRNKRQAVYNKLFDRYEARLIPEFYLHGIHPVGGKTDQSIICDCGAATGKLRKELEVHVAWEDDMWKPKSDSFNGVKQKIEAQCNEAFSSSYTLLSEGYGGTTVLACRLKELNALNLTLNRRKREINEVVSDNEVQANSNSTDQDTNSTTTTTPKPTTTTIPKLADDLVICEIEIEFGGDIPKDPPKDEVDSILKKKNKILEFGFSNIKKATGAYCTFEDLSIIGAPEFLTSDLKFGKVVPSSQYLPYTCTDPDKMLPNYVDLDSNFALEVFCVDGKYIAPFWPEQCEPEAVCSTIPHPPDADIALVRADNRTKYRAGEQVYFVCSDSRAVLNDDSGINMFEVSCPSESLGWENAHLLDFPQANNISWPTCIVNPSCNDFPIPNNASGLVKLTENEYVEVGEFVEYACIRRGEFYETPNGPTIKILCNNPDYPQDNHKVSSKEDMTPETWPVCKQLPCQCLGYADGMDIEESLNILQNTCKSEDNVLAYKSVYDLKYTIPKRENCGTYKPKNTNITSRCFCDDIYDPPLTFVNELQVLDFAWKPNLANAATSMFWKRKKRVEEALDRFYLERPDGFFKTNGYIRTIAYRFKKGNDNKQVGMEGKNYVKVTVEHQFNANSSMTLEVLQDKHRKLLSDLQGKLQKTPDDPVLLNVVPSSVIQANHTCSKGSLFHLDRPNYVINNTHEWGVGIGDYIQVTCLKDIQLFTNDIWDDDPDDNILTIKCRSDRKFDIPQKLPDCLAQCAKEKPLPPPENNIVLDTTRTSEGKLWENENLWYTCKNKKDGIAVKKGNDGTMEGSDNRDQSYECNGDGEYTVPKDPMSGQPEFPFCIPRPIICKCLGEYKEENFSISALDLHCRNDTYVIKNSLHAPDKETNEIPQQIVPNKTRCGTSDPLEMIEENKCYCHTKEGLGAKAGSWITLELWNIPWRDDFLDLNSEAFKSAKYIVERAMDIAFIADNFFFNNGFVRTIVMRFTDGWTELNPVWAQLIDLAMANNSNLTSLDNFPEGLLIGDPIIGLFELKDMFEDGKRGISETTYYTTKVHLEVQFLKEAPLNLKDVLLENILVDDWVNKQLWVNETCFAPPNAGYPDCYVEHLLSCINEDLSTIFAFGLTHDNFENGPVPVGSTVNIHCPDAEYENEFGISEYIRNKRIDKDKWDGDPNDYMISVLCMPEGWDLPSMNDLPDCKAWCPAQKPNPPNKTGLGLRDNQVRSLDQEFWEGEDLYYECIDTSLGVDANSSNFKMYKCIADKPIGRYNTPRVNHSYEEWPICQPKTTTVKPEIKMALKVLLNNALMELNRNKTQELYLASQALTEKNYFLNVTLPAFIGLAIMVLICLCCSRNDSPLSRYFYGSGHNYKIN